jgi:hypothetical protein
VRAPRGLFERSKGLGTGTGFAGANRILRPVGPQDASLARRLSEILRLRPRRSLAQDDEHARALRSG